MEGARDWRRREETDAPVTLAGDAIEGEVAAVEEVVQDKPDQAIKKPVNYYLSTDEDGSWQQRIQAALMWSGPEPLPWEPSSVVVYGREIKTPQHYNGYVYWDFERLAESFGPADYITMASTYHTFIIDNVPILTHEKKNEARRFITLLDALYEARCKLIIRARNPPDTLFFPKKKSSASGKPGNSDEPDDLYSETIAEVYQDQMSPFRPNVAYYDTKSSTSSYDPDQDSDFGLQKKPVNFSNTSAFTEKTSASHTSAPSLACGSCVAHNGTRGRENGGSLSPSTLGTGRAVLSLSALITRLVPAGSAWARE
ncbi:hypothetical protein NW754_008832 [Fusarium falciforme]|nr:hypothetical protein NW754_008832 [Fusarium falciforme]